MNKGIDIYFLNVIKRYDDDGIIPYYSAKDFDALRADEFTFEGPDGNIIFACYYYYDTPRDDRIIIFAHGIGGGHRSYFREIERLCKAGYRVLAYDNVGCFRSGGDSIGSVTGFASALKECIRYAENDCRNDGMKITLVGHSCGGYAVGMNMGEGKRVDRGVIISGFSDVSEFIKGYAPKEAVDAGIEYERQFNREPFDKKAAEAVNLSGRPTLVIQSSDDTVVSPSIGIEVFEAECPLARVIKVDGKGHNPNYTVDAVKYMTEAFTEYLKMVENGELKTNAEKSDFMRKKDLQRMTEQDEDIWRIILDFSDN